MLNKRQKLCQTPNCVCVKNLLARAVKNMFFILMNHSECGGKFSKMCPCHDLSCQRRDQGQMGETGPAGGCQESPSLAEETGLLTASATNRLCGLERITSLSEPSFLVSQR